MFKKRTPGGTTEVMKGIHLKTLVYGDDTLMTEVHLEKGASIPTHGHPYEQTGYLVSGRMEFNIDGVKQFAEAGDSWSIANNVEHSATAIEDTIVVEIFSPVREEYLAYYTPNEQ